MSSEIIDLDIFVGEPRKARLAGHTYLFPRDIPAELYLEILALQQSEDQLEDADVVRKLRDDLLELFQVHQPKLKKLPAAVSIAVLVRAIGAIYRAEPDESADAGGDPQPGSGGKKPQSRSRSRSSKSSGS